MKKSFTVKSLFIAAAAMMMSWSAQSATVTGDFEKITSISDLTSGQYIVADATDGFVMVNQSSGTAYILSTTIPTVTDNKISNPDDSIVWTIATHADGGYTILNGSSYVAYSGSGNSGYFATVVDAKARWTISYDATNAYFKVENAASSGRYLQYNTQSPRFACYTGTQKYLHLYKLESNCTKPELSFAITEIDKKVGDAAFTYTATSTAGSTGTITYSSSNTDVAEVNATTGEVTVKRAGTADITASITAIGTFCDGSASYSLEVFPAIGNEKDYNLVTSASDLVADAIYLIVGVADKDEVVDSLYAMGVQNANNRGAIRLTNFTSTTITVEPASEVFTGDVYYPYEFTLKTYLTGWAFYDALNDKYLTPISGSNNYLRLSEPQVAWDLTLLNDTITTIAQDNDSTQFARATLRFNPGSTVNIPLFSCYTSTASQNPIYLYKKDVNTGIAHAIAPSAIQVAARDGSIIISGAAEKAHITVYDLSGKLLKKTASTVIPLTDKGVYIVKVDGKAFKVLNK